MKPFCPIYIMSRRYLPRFFFNFIGGTKTKRNAVMAIAIAIVAIVILAAVLFMSTTTSTSAGPKTITETVKDDSRLNELTAGMM